MAFLRLVLFIYLFIFTSIVPNGEVAAVGPLRSQAEEELMSGGRLVSIHRSDCLDSLSDTPNLK